MTPIRVQHVPAAHPYPRRVTAPGSAGGVRPTIFLGDPPVAGAAPGQWWPHPALEPGWLRRHAATVDVVHVHFGFEHRTPAQLAAWTEEVARLGIGLVVTVHDLENPHLHPAHPGKTSEAARHLESVGVLVRRADAVTTLTAGAACRIRARFGRDSIVHPHPHLVARSWLERPRPVHEGYVVGVHLKSLRANSDLDLVLDELLPAVATLPEARLRVHLHADVLDPDHPRHDPRVRDLVTATDPVLDLRLHGPLSDEELWGDLLDTDLAVLPYRGGTHSGWLEMCHDLGTAVLAPNLGHFAEQRPVRVWRRSRPGALAAAVRAAYDDHVAGLRPVRPAARERLRERAELADLHHRLYAAAAQQARSRAGAA